MHIRFFLTYFLISINISREIYIYTHFKYEKDNDIFLKYFIFHHNLFFLFFFLYMYVLKTTINRRPKMFLMRSKRKQSINN